LRGSGQNSFTVYIVASPPTFVARTDATFLEVRSPCGWHVYVEIADALLFRSLLWLPLLLRG